MVIKETDISNFIDTLVEKPIEWVQKAREQNTMLKALINGDGFSEELINNIEFVESAKRAQARRKYSKDIRDLFDRVTKKRKNIFEADGGSETINIKNDTILNSFSSIINNFKSNLSLFNYLEENFFKLADVDPNGIILLEYKTKENNEYDLYPTYKSIQDIYSYHSDGQCLDYILFEPVIKKLGLTEVKTWRLIDNENDYCIKEVGGSYFVDNKKTFQHPFGKVPALVLSNQKETGTELRQSFCHKILELAKEYARDKSVLTIYKFQKGFPLHWRLGSKCEDCNGLGHTGDGICKTCNGTGYPQKTDVTDVTIFPIPEDGQTMPNELGGFISPDLETWKQYKEDLKDLEIRIEDTFWGTDKASQLKKTSETATGRYIDTQPYTNELNGLSNVLEYMYNTISGWVLNFVDQTKQDKEEILYYRTFGRRYIIENPDVLLEKYQQAKREGCNNLILDKILNEYILSKYKSDNDMKSKMIKKFKVEPYPHQTLNDISVLFGKREANKKILFQKFWQEADTKKDSTQLIKEFEQYNNNLNTIKNESMQSI